MKLLITRPLPDAVLAPARAAFDLTVRESTAPMSAEEMTAALAEQDIILRDEFESMEGLDVLWTLTEDPKSSLLQERIDAGFLENHVPDLNQNFYLCGPDPMVKDLRGLLDEAGAEVGNVTWEK